MRLLPVIFLAFLSSGPAWAGVEIAQVSACLDAAGRDGTAPGHCIDAAQSACLDNARETPAVATLCFTEAREAWSAALSDVIAGVTAKLEEKPAAVARIETKYNLLANLTECDRIEELSIAVSDLDAASIALQTAQCQATAAAATYVHLYRRAAALTAAAKP